MGGAPVRADRSGLVALAARDNAELRQPVRIDLPTRAEPTDSYLRSSRRPTGSTGLVLLAAACENDGAAALAVPRLARRRDAAAPKALGCLATQESGGT